MCVCGGGYVYQQSTEWVCVGGMCTNSPLSGGVCVGGGMCNNSPLSVCVCGGVCVTTVH